MADWRRLRHTGETAPIPLSTVQLTMPDASPGGSESADEAHRCTDEPPSRGGRSVGGQSELPAPDTDSDPPPAGVDARPSAPLAKAQDAQLNESPAAPSCDQPEPSAPPPGPTSVAGDPVPSPHDPPQEPPDKRLLVVRLRFDSAEGVATALNLGDDVVCGGFPDKRFGVEVPILGPGDDRSAEFGDAAERAAA